MKIANHSRSAIVAYQDLLRQLQDDEASVVIGAIEERTVNKRIYLYEKFRVGAEVKSRYLGEDSPALRERIAKAEALRSQAKDRAAERTRLVRILRAEGYARTDSSTGALLAAFSRTGVFRLGGTIVGTTAYTLYEGELGVRLPRDEFAQTGDIDIAGFERLSVALDDRVTEETGAVLAGLAFDPVPSLYGRHVWRWKQTTQETLVEFLTPAFGEEGIRDLPALGVSAQALNYLNFLIADPIKAVALYRSGILVQIPRAERYAIHKLIAADRRKGGSDALKARKDRAQAAFLIEVLAEDRPDELAEAWTIARETGPRWRERIDASLVRMPETAARLASLGLT